MQTYALQCPGNAYMNNLFLHKTYHSLVTLPKRCNCQQIPEATVTCYLTHSKAPTTILNNVLASNVKIRQAFHIKVCQTIL